MEFTGKVTWKEEEFTYRIAVQSDRLVMTFSSTVRVLHFDGAGSDLNCPGLRNIPTAVAPLVHASLGIPGQWQLIETLSVQQAAAAAADGGSSQHSKSVASALRLVVRPVGLPEMQFELQEDLGREDAVEHLKRFKQQLEAEKQARATAVTDLMQQLKQYKQLLEQTKKDQNTAVTELKQLVEQRRKEAQELKQQLVAEQQARIALEAQLTQLISSAFFVKTLSGLVLPGSLGAQLVCRTVYPGTVEEKPDAVWTETVHTDAAAPVALCATDQKCFEVTRDCAKLEVQLRLRFTDARPSRVVVSWNGGDNPTMPAVTDDVYTATVVVPNVKKGHSVRGRAVQLPHCFRVHWEGKDARLVQVATENWIAFRELP